MDWKLSVQIYVPLGDTFTVGASEIGGVDSLGYPNFQVGRWVDLTCEAGEINIRQGYADPNPLSMYETGMCDLHLKGLTYAPTLNEDILPGVQIRVLISKPQITSEFAGTYSGEFLTTTTPENLHYLFRGYILDAVEDRKAGTVKIEAVDDWHKVVNLKANTTDYSNDQWLWADQIVEIGDVADNTPEMKRVIPMACTTTPSIKSGDEFYGNQTFLTAVMIGGPFQWESYRSGSGTFTMTRLVADLPEDCVPGVATVDSTSTAASGTFANTTKYYRYKIDVTGTGPNYLEGIAPVAIPVWWKGASIETIKRAMITAMGTVWVNPENIIVFGSNAIWRYDENYPWVNPVGTDTLAFSNRVIRVSDIHTGEHLCYYDFEQRSSLTSALNSIEATNYSSTGVATTTVYEDAGSVAQYGRLQTKVETCVGAGVVWPGNEIIKVSRFPQSQVNRVWVELRYDNMDLLPRLHDTVQFEHNGTTQFRRVAKRRVSLTPKTMTAEIEFFDYIPYEGLD